MATTTKIVVDGPIIPARVYNLSVSDTIVLDSGLGWRLFAFSQISGFCAGSEDDIIDYLATITAESNYPDLLALYYNLFLEKSALSAYILAVYGLQIENPDLWIPLASDDYEFSTRFGPIFSSVVNAQAIRSLEFKYSLNSTGFWNKELIPVARILFPRPMTYKKPVLPIFHPLRRSIPKKPVLKLATMAQLRVPTFYNDTFGIKRASWITRQERRIEAINARRLQTFERKNALYEKRLVDRQRRIDDHAKKFNARIEKYQRRMSKWTSLASVRSTTRLKLVRTTRNKGLGTPWNDFAYIYLGFKHPKPYLDLSRSSDSNPQSSSGVTIGNSCFPDGVSFSVSTVDRLLTFKRVVPGQLTSSDTETFGADTFNLVSSALWSTIGNTISKSENKLIEKIANQQVHFGQMLAEYAQTTKLLVESVTLIVRFLKSRKYLYDYSYHFGRNPKAIASSYLAFKFGLQPLVNDLSGICDLLLKNQQLRNEVRTHVTWFTSVTSNGFRFEGRFSFSHHARYAISNQFVRSLQEYGLVNPAEIAWELVPWSFVVDWFLPIGNFITQLSAFVGTEDFSRLQKLTFIGKIINEETGEEWADIVFRDRKILLGPPIGTLPLLKNPLSFTHSLEALALFVQKFITGK